MRVTRHPPDKHIQFDYTLHQQRLEQVLSTKYLGSTITDDLDWGQHISEISAKAIKTMGFLRRNLAFAPKHTKAYKTLVRRNKNIKLSSFKSSGNIQKKEDGPDSSSMQLLFGIPVINLRLDRWRRCRGQLPGVPAGDGGV